MEDYLRLWILYLQFICVTGWQCPSGKDISKIYTESGKHTIIDFQTTLQTVNGQLLYIVASFNSSRFYSATFYNNVLRNEKSSLASEFIGDARSGNFTVKTIGVQRQDGGVYMLQYSKTNGADFNTDMCSMLFVLGKPLKATIFHDNNNVLGKNSSLTCHSSSTTYPTNHTLKLTYNWKVNGVRDPSTTKYSYGDGRKTLTIMSVNREDSNKTFECNASESGNTIKGFTSDFSAQLVFTVIYGPDSNTTMLSPSTGKYNLTEGVRLNDITCIGDCYPKCNFKWTKPGANGASEVSYNAVLSLGTLSRADAATYTCEVTNANTTVRTVRKEVVVHVNYGPNANTTKLTPSSVTYTRNEGDSLHDIQCSGNCYPSCNYKWTKSGGSTSGNSESLSLGSLDRTEAGTYTCTVTNPATDVKQTKTVSIFVRYGPDTCKISSVSPLTLTEGESSPTVSCESECYRSCLHTWSNMSSRSPIGENGRFQLVNATRYQAGNYKCFCRNTGTPHYVKNHTTFLKIIIQYPPVVSVMLSTEDAIEGNELTIRCAANGVPSDYNYNGLSQTWNGSTIPNTNGKVSDTLTNSTLYIPSLQLQDTGAYTCYVNNGVKKADSFSSEIVKVKVLPKILTRLLKFTGETDGAVNVSVLFYSYPDIQEVVYKRQDNQTIRNGTTKYIVSYYETTVQEMFYGKEVRLKGMQANMMISDLKQEDFGSYTLILKNELGKTITPFSVDAESEPSAPTGFKYIFKAGTHSFTWHGGFNGGQFQTFFIETSIADQDSWQNITTVMEKMDTQNDYWANVSGLQPGTYSARLFARNVYGRSDYVVLNSTFTISEIVFDVTPIPVAAVIGGCSAAIVVFAIAAVSICVYKRRFGNKDGSRSRLNKWNASAERDSDEEDEVNTVNPMYISADEVKPGLSAENTYAQPVKKNKQDIYAMVDKKTKKNGPKKDNKGKKKKVTDGDIYENAPEKTGDTKRRNAYDENPYENPENSTAAQRPVKNVNKDGLIYADLTFNDQPKGQKKLVIHGLDSMTEYVEVDFTKKAEPLPESDEEK